MNFSDNFPPFMLSPPAPFATESDSVTVTPQFPMNDETLDPHSPLDQPPSFKRARISESNNHSNALPCPPTNSRTHLQPPNPAVNRGTSHIFFKTRMCAKFRMGACRNGENCNFAHGVEDMRQPPPNWQELVGLRNEERSSSGNWDDDQKIIHKMKICKKYYNGEECPYGDRCSFLHEDPAKFREDLGRFRECSAITIGTNANESKISQGNGSNNSESNRAANAGLNVIRANGRSTYWKTKLCIKWEVTGHCPFGEDCHFAHGQAELQVSGGRIEAEATGSVSVPAKATVPILTRAITVPTNDAPPSNTTSLTPANEEEQGKKYLLKWKGGRKKINRIYGDWLDDVPLVHNLPSKVET